jgi:hypothetical protein
MPDKFDPYREALVMETITVWPEGSDELGPEEKHRIAAALHEDAASCSQLEYIRLHTGFCRKILVTPEDLQRLASAS